MCSLCRSTNVLASKYNSTYNHYCPNNWQQKWVHLKWTCQNCVQIQYFVGAPLLSSTALILLGMIFTRAAQVVTGILFHSSTKTSWSCWMLDAWYFSTFRLRIPHMWSIGFRSGDILGHSITFTFSSKAVVISAVCLSWLCWKRLSEGRASSSASEWCYHHHAWL